MADPSWGKHMADVLRRNGIRLFATVPDYIVSQVLEPLWADPECTVVTVTREEEGLGLLSGAYLPADGAPSSCRTRASATA